MHTAAPLAAARMPLPPRCIEIIEVLGHRECDVATLPSRSFHNGPEESERCVSYKIHGKFGEDEEQDHGIPGIKWISLACLLLWFDDEELEPINQYEKTLHERMKKLRAVTRRETARAATLRQRQR